jgi:FKBP-type peptidyl-prolyl cis-trans isomerase 2
VQSVEDFNHAVSGKTFLHKIKLAGAFENKKHIGNSCRDLEGKWKKAKL